jgi:hypothetical protein
VSIKSIERWHEDNNGRGKKEQRKQKSLLEKSTHAQVELKKPSVPLLEQLRKGFFCLLHAVSLSRSARLRRSQTLFL